MSYELVGILLTVVIQALYIAHRIGRFEEKLIKIEEKQDKHNNLVERTFKLEGQVDVLKENPEWLLFTFAALGVSLAACYGIKKFEEWQENAQIKLEKKEHQLEVHQEKTDALVQELGNRGIYPKFRTKFNLRPQGEESDEEIDAPEYSNNPPAPIKYKDEQTSEYLDTMASQGIRPRNRHRVNDGSVPMPPKEYSREAYREKYFPTEQGDASLTGETTVDSSASKGRDEVQDLVVEIFKNNPTNQGPSQQ